MNGADAVSLHGTVVAWHGRGLLLRGEPGAGKSDLALRLIAAGALLVADDQVLIRDETGSLTAAAPGPLAGLIELRGVGLIRMPYLLRVRIAVILDLVTLAEVDRLPDAATVSLLGRELPRVAVFPFEATAPQKVIALLRGRPDF